MTDESLDDYIYKEMTGEEFCKLFPNLSKKLVKLTKESECHNKFQFKTGLNKDRIPFNPTGECQAGGIYFTDIDNITRWLEYNYKEMKYCRTVILEPDCKVYIENGKFKANKIKLEERIEIKDLSCWSDNDYCLNAVRQNVKSLKYIRYINNDIQLEAVKNNVSAIIYLLGKKIEISKELQMEVVKRDPFAIAYLLDHKIDVPKEVQLEAVKQNRIAIKFLLHYEVDVSDEVRLAAGFSVKQIYVK